MSKFINIVKVKVKPSHKDEYLKLMNARPAFDGQVSSYVAETGSSQFHMVATWHSEEAIAKARPQMIEFLDYTKVRTIGLRVVIRIGSDRTKHQAL